MNKEQTIDEAYVNFEKWYNEHSGKEDYTGYYVPTKEEFIRLIKTDSTFSEKWGLKIEERELSLEERGEWDSKRDNVRNTWVQTIQTFTPNEVRTWLNEKNVPTRLITITYNNETIESYE